VLMAGRVVMVLGIGAGPEPLQTHSNTGPKPEEPHSARTAAGEKKLVTCGASAPEGIGPQAKGSTLFSLARISRTRQPCSMSLTSSAAGCNPDLDPEGLTGRLSIVILSFC